MSSKSDDTLKEVITVAEIHRDPNENASLLTVAEIHQ